MYHFALRCFPAGEYTCGLGGGGGAGASGGGGGGANCTVVVWVVVVVWWCWWYSGVNTVADPAGGTGFVAVPSAPGTPGKTKTNTILVEARKRGGKN